MFNVGGGFITNLKFIVGPVQIAFLAFTENVAVIFVFVIGAVKAGISLVPEVPIEKEELFTFQVYDVVGFGLLNAGIITFFPEHTEISGIWSVVGVGQEIEVQFCISGCAHVAFDGVRFICTVCP
jgi:hypothetical protein